MGFHNLQTGIHHQERLLLQSEGFDPHQSTLRCVDILHVPVNLLFDSGYHRDSSWCFQKYRNKSILASTFSLLSCGFRCYVNFPKLALVFKCASDTIFLDDFKSVLDGITAKAFARTGGLVHKGGSAGQRSQSGVDASTHKADGLGYGTAVTIHAEQPLRDTGRKWVRKLFARHDNGNKKGPEDIQIQRDTAITLSNLKPPMDRNENFGSSDRILPKPETTASRYPHGPRALNLPAEDSSKDWKP